MKTSGILILLKKTCANHWNHRWMVPRRGHNSSSWSSCMVREEFQQYFEEHHQHHRMRSSPVVPWNDPTLAFTNAGMNQFKKVLLGEEPRPHPRVVNSQKCIRVGGKHNDLEDVGTDSTHQTFFEMLGTWSFGDYFKPEACNMAWDFLTNRLGLRPEDLYCTYFAGDENVSPDLETREIWHNLGVPEERVLGFGRENFWDMGFVGPCGPCSEIHYDHEHQGGRVKHLVNTGHPSVVELWNLVFIQHERHPDGKLSRLREAHVDTGMGLERLTAILQESKSNYDTDLFTPLFASIQQMSGKPGYGKVDKLDVSYRIIADHARMATVALADGMFPEHSQKLRFVIRRALEISQRDFGHSCGLLQRLSEGVAETLGDPYPEIPLNLQRIHNILSYEAELYENMKRRARDHGLDRLGIEGRLFQVPGVVGASEEIDRKKRMGIYSISTEIPKEEVLRIGRSYSLSIPLLKGLLEMKKLPFPLINESESLEADNSLEVASFPLGLLSPDCISLLESDGLPATDDAAKYHYHPGASRDSHYRVPAVRAKVVALFANGQRVQSVETGEAIVITDRTNFYAESGGQVGDQGFMYAKGEPHLRVRDTKKQGGYCLHVCDVLKELIRVGEELLLCIDEEFRTDCARNHSATHLLNAALRQVLQGTVGQHSSRVDRDHLHLGILTMKGSLSVRQIHAVTDLVRKAIESDVPVKTKTTKIMECVLDPRATLVPGEVYPDDVRLVSMETPDDFSSKEPCCGTHVICTGDIQHFLIVSQKAVTSSLRTLKAVTGSEAVCILEKGQKLLDEVKRISGSVGEGLEQLIKQIRKRLLSELVPYEMRIEIEDKLDAIEKEFISQRKDYLVQKMKEEMLGVLSRNKDLGFVVHMLECIPKATDVSIPLIKVTRLCKDRPILIFGLTHKALVARCSVSQASLIDCQAESKKLSAEKWCEDIVRLLDASGSAPKGQDPQLVFNIRKELTHDELSDQLIEEAVVLARHIASKHYL